MIGQKYAKGAEKDPIPRILYKKERQYPAPSACTFFLSKNEIITYPTKETGKRDHPLQEEQENKYLCTRIQPLRQRAAIQEAGEPALDLR